MNQFHMTMVWGARAGSGAMNRLATIRAIAIALCCLGGLGWESLAVAQGTKRGDTPKQQPIAKPEELRFETTQDRNEIPLDVPLAATYYASNKGKDAVPILMLHAYAGSQADYKELALGLQALGHAVLTLDLAQ